MPRHSGDEEQAVFQVVEAIFVAVLVASALIFFALVQKPTPSPQGAGLDLARMAGDALFVLQGDDPGGANDELQEAVRQLRDSGTAAAAEASLRTDVAGALPEGLRFVLRVTPGGGGALNTCPGAVAACVYGPTDVEADPRNAQGAVTYVLDDATPTPTLVLVELVVWNAF